jgi:solute carrier family 25 (mitochondrial oxoglutarate transporter), member 11
MQNFLIGGVSGMFATTVIQPIDFVKVQIQVRSEMGSKELSPFKISKSIYKETGKISTFYKGLDSALLRQILYTSTRLGLFYNIKDYIVKQKGKQPSMLENTCASLFAGAVGSFVGNPADLALVRMQSDNNLPVNERRNYKNVVDALVRTVREEGVLTLWRGSFPTIARAMAMNFSLLVPFEETKKLLTPYISSAQSRAIVASLIAGGCASVLSLPFDNVKTKLQKMNKGADGSLPYKGLLDCFLKTAKKEGAARLWVGLNTYYVRIAPHAIISLVTNEFLRNMFDAKNKK